MMQLRKRFLTALVPLIFSSPLFAQHDVHAVLIPPAARKAAPAFRLKNEAGKELQVKDFKGKVVLLDFWATECGGCVLEIPSFIELQQAYKDKEFTAVGVSMDIPYEDLKSPEEAWSKVKPFVAAHKLNYPILMGDESISREYNLQAYPMTCLLDKSGKIAATYVGVVSKADVETNIKALLAEK
jgi:peroxiredoxin